MAFNEITKGEFTGKAPAFNSVRLYTTKSMLKISVSKDLLSNLGDPMFFRVATGSGKHEGLVALIPTRSKSANAYRVNGAVGAITITASKIGAINCPKTTKVPHEITDDGLIIDVRAVIASALQAAE